MSFYRYNSALSLRLFGDDITPHKPAEKPVRVDTSGMNTPAAETSEAEVLDSTAAVVGEEEKSEDVVDEVV
jgi:hypothetical protein